MQPQNGGNFNIQQATPTSVSSAFLHTFPRNQPLNLRTTASGVVSSEIPNVLCCNQNNRRKTVTFLETVECNGQHASLDELPLPPPPQTLSTTSSDGANSSSLDDEESTITSPTDASDYVESRV
jgi:hypothetical protein